MKDLLMIPGPVEIPDRIIEAFNGQTVAHYGSKFRDLYLKTTGMLSTVLGSEGWSFLMPGSGTTALEAIGANFCLEKRCLIVNNGYFGARIYEISSRYCSETDQVCFEKGEIIDLEQVEKQLKKKKYDLLWAVHVDTSVGILNPIEKIASLAKNYGCMVFVDAIASSAVEELKMDEWKIDGVASASQKGFACPPGLGMLTLTNDLVQTLNKLPEARTWYSDLRIWMQYYHNWNDWHPYPSTMPTNTVMALNKSLEIIEEQGIENKIRMHREASKKVVKAVKILGLDIFVPDGYNAHGLTPITTLGKVNAYELVNFLKEKLSIHIGGSLDKKMKPLVLRLAHMSSKQCHSRNLASVISGIGTYMQLKDYNVDLERALSVLM